jgi:hypothetical protein
MLVAKQTLAFGARVDEGGDGPVVHLQWPRRLLRHASGAVHVPQAQPAADREVQAQQPHGNVVDETRDACGWALRCARYANAAHTLARLLRLLVDFKELGVAAVHENAPAVLGRIAVHRDRAAVR